MIHPTKGKNMMRMAVYMNAVFGLFPDASSGYETDKAYQVVHLIEQAYGSSRKIKDCQNGFPIDFF
jgi:hypothetical protein